MTQRTEHHSFPPAADSGDRCSGLDDIRRLKRASTASRPADRVSLDPRDSLFGMGVGTSPTLLAPPAAARRGRVRTVALLAAVALVAASGTALGMAGLSRGGEPQTPPTEKRADASGSGATEADPPTGGAAVVAEAPDEASDRAGDPPEAEPADTAPTEADPKLATREARTPRPVRRNPAKPAAAKGATDEPEPDPAADRDEDGSIDSLLDRALGSAPARSEPEEPALPQTPSRSEVASALRDLQSAVRACADGEHGVARTRIVVEGATGRVRSVNVSGDFAGTEVGSCIARTVREQAEMPRFARDRFEISFPYVL